MLRVVILLLALTLPVGSDTPQVVNEFAKSYNYWITLMNNRPATNNLVVDAREIRAWKETQDKWKALDKYVSYK